MHYAILMLIFSAAEVIIIDQAFQKFNPFLFMAAFYTFAFIILMINIAIKKENIEISEIKENKKILSGYVASGAIGNTLWLISLYLMGPTGLALIAVVLKVFVLIYSVKVLNEKMTAIQYIMSGIIIFCAGVFSNDSNTNEIIGVSLCFLSHLLYTISDLIQKRLSTKVNWNIAITLRQLIQSLMAISFSLFYIIIKDYNYLEFIELNFLIFAISSALIGAVFSKVFQYKAMETIDMTKITIIDQFEAVLIFLVAIIFFNEEITNLQLISGIVMLLALKIIIFQDYKIKKSKKN